MRYTFHDFLLENTTKFLYQKPKDLDHVSSNLSLNIGDARYICARGKLNNMAAFSITLGIRIPALTKTCFFNYEKTLTEYTRDAGPVCFKAPI